MSDSLFFTVLPELDNERIDRAIVSQLESVSRSAVQKLIENQEVTIDGLYVGKNYRVKSGQEVCIHVPKPRQLNIEAQNIPLDVRYEDEDLLVVNKPKGMVVHPAAGNFDNTLVNALLFYCSGSLSGINGVIRPGIVHRIDKETSGLLVVAKNDMAHISLAKQIKDHSFTREYRAVVHGNLKNDCESIDAPIGRSKKDRKKMAVTHENSRNALTSYEVIQRFKGYTYVKIKLKTGRTHQIRVHMAYIGHPVAGDMVYGYKNTLGFLGGQCLHAGLIGFVHPKNGEYIEVSSELPVYFKSFLNKLEDI
ncbi:MAG: RluA family pseudouridine synthase [Oscillospiraceae bacterium]|jgi:23S rRNA pseudouridine1911/1915/1917 synthase|nr:RluA family pseudouridine synthase [Oscillospiraceae bacterium]